MDDSLPTKIRVTKEKRFSLDLVYVMWKGEFA